MLQAVSLRFRRHFLTSSLSSKGDKGIVTRDLLEFTVTKWRVCMILRKSSLNSIETWLVTVVRPIPRDIDLRLHYEFQGNWKILLWLPRGGTISSLKIYLNKIHVDRVAEFPLNTHNTDHEELEQWLWSWLNWNSLTYNLDIIDKKEVGYKMVNQYKCVFTCCYDNI